MCLLLIVVSSKRFDLEADSDAPLLFRSTLNSENFSHMNPPFIPSLFWLCLGAYVPAHTMVNITLVGTVIKLSKSHSDLPSTDTVVREGVVRVQPNEIITVLSKYPTHKIFWTGFNLNCLMQPLIVFYVEHFSVTCASNNCSGSTFDQILISEGDGWNLEKSRFIAPQSGIYVFSVSVVLLKRDIASCTALNLHKNSQVVQMSQAGVTDLMTTGEDLLTQSHLMLLNAKDEIFITINDGKTDANPFFNDSTNLQISFSGFYYNLAAGNRVRKLCHLVFKLLQLRV